MNYIEPLYKQETTQALATETQAIGRAHRQGQSRNVVVTRYSFFLSSFFFFFFSFLFLLLYFLIYSLVIILFFVWLMALFAVDSLLETLSTIQPT